jgi:two-component system response regulator AtoC
VKVLVVDDDSGLRRALTLILEDGGYQVDLASDGKDGLERARNGRPDLILSDVRMPGMDGLDLVEQLRAAGITTPVVVMTAYGSMDLAVEAVRRGASDYLAKPFGAQDVLLTLRKVEERFNLLRPEEVDDPAPGGRRRYGALLAASPRMIEVAEMALKVARHPTSVLVQGPTGTGKELLARLIHDNSQRSSAPFVAVNCGAIPDNLLESEFFGVMKGAFTGAERDRPGLFEAASGGTLFLDELGELPENLQVKLLRALQEGTVRRLGADQEAHVDVRVLGATNRRLMDEVAAGRFREDLYYRLAVVTLEVPPLRERPEDLELLIRHFLESRARRLGVEVPEVSEGAMAVLRVHRWPGNVRELENVLERALIMAEGRLIRAGDLPANLASAIQVPAFPDRPLPAPRGSGAPGMGANSGSGGGAPDGASPSRGWHASASQGGGPLGGSAGGPAGAHGGGPGLQDPPGEEDLSVKRRSAALEKDLIRKALEKTGGHRGQASELLELSDRALRYKIREYGLDDRDDAADQVLGADAGEEPYTGEEGDAAG